MKRILSLTSFITIPVLFFAQAGELWVKKSDKGLYLEHKVMPKEGLFPLGRMYNVHPRHIANFNGLDFNKGLVLGQLIKIPLSDTNFNQKSNSGVPVYYKVGESDGLMRVSTMHNKVSLESLRQWNNLTSDNINFGTTLVVGYLVSKEMNAAAIPAVVKTEPVVEKPKTEMPKADPPKTEVKTEVVKLPEPPPSEVQKEEPKTIVEVKQPEKKPEIIPVVKIEASEEGYFKWHFEQQAKLQAVSNDKTVTSGIFKTTSGWTDGKYYLLIDGVVSGTIVKITNPTTNKSVYAKVLGQMEGINLNKGLDIRISNAAASALGVTETDKFIVKANY